MQFKMPDRLKSDKAQNQNLAKKMPIRRRWAKRWKGLDRAAKYLCISTTDH